MGALLDPGRFGCAKFCWEQRKLEGCIVYSDQWLQDKSLHKAAAVEINSTTNVQYWLNENEQLVGVDDWDCVILTEELKPNSHDHWSWLFGELRRLFAMKAVFVKFHQACIYAFALRSTAHIHRIFPLWLPASSRIVRNAALFYCSYENILLSYRCQRAAFYGKRDNLRRPEKIFRSCSLSVSSVCRSLDIFCLPARSWQKCRRSFLRLHRRLWLCIDPLFCSSLEIRREISLCVSLV